jgi:hypothetical protein
MSRSWKRNASPRERFEARVIRSADGCWRWRGVLNASGYATTRILGRTTLVHRISYELFIGTIAALISWEWW